MGSGLLGVHILWQTPNSLTTSPVLLILTHGHVMWWFTCFAPT